MSVTPSGILSEPIDHARTLLANASAWQSWVGASDATQAKDSIHIGATPPPADGETYTQNELANLWPLAIIDLPPDGGGYQVSRNADGVDQQFPESGRVVMAFEDKVPDQHLGSPADARLAFFNNLGAVMLDMLQLSGTDDGTNAYLWLRGINILEGPVREDLNEVASVGAYHWVVLDLPWGFGSG
jgi:hypothetical protein